MSAARGISVHIGVIELDTVHYQGWNGSLSGCENDATDMQNLARKQGFQTSLLLTRAATRKNVIRAIEQAARQLKKGDLFLLTFSGHGGQIPRQPDARPADLYDVEQTDNLDETWCLHDAQLLDDELNHLYRQFQTGVRILLIQDCCHSGFSDFDDSAVTGVDSSGSPAPGSGQTVEPSDQPQESESDTGATPPAGRPKAMPRELIGNTYEQNRRFYDNIRANIPRPADGSDFHETAPASILAISACHEDEEAMDGTFNGFFTSALNATWEYGSFTDYGTFSAQIGEKLSNNSAASQTPEMYSCATDRAWIRRARTAKLVPWASQSPFQIQI
jgi:hypothetical protein